MFEKFTDRARQVIILARKEADRFNHNYIGTEHILLGLIKLGEGVAVNVLRKMNLDFETVRMEVEKAVGSGPETKMIGDIPLTARAKRVIELALDEAKRLSHTYIGTEHLLLGLLREGEGVAAKILQSLNLDIEATRVEILKELGSEYSEKEGGGQEAGQEEVQSNSRMPALTAFGRDLTELAAQHKLDPVIGREDEIERVVQVLSRRRKNNPVLIGEAGVGKTAIVEGLAQSIVTGEIPESLAGKKLITLDLALMVAGTKYRGQFEERIKSVMQEIKNSKNIILFIDELHTIVGAGAAEGAIDASNILKPALARGELQCIGATTMDEYRKYIEKDAALERRFQTIIVDPPTPAQAIAILKGLRPKYEAYHRAVITDEAIEQSVLLSDRYITGRFLPDKAIDLIDEASAKARIKAATEPEEIKHLNEESKNVKSKKELAVAQQDFEKAAKFRDEERNVKFRLEAAITEWKEHKKDEKVIVGEENIQQIISKWTKIPLTRIEESESSRLLRMEDELHQMVIGQHKAVESVARAVRRARADLKDPRRPMGTFIFLGPTGVGKTLLARALAQFMFDDPDSLIQLDMSEYMEKFGVSRLTGSPPGYVGYEEGGQLTEKVRRRPYSVVLFDELEKAHPDIYNILLQIMEEGKLTDSMGRTVDFRNTFLIITSNVGADLIKKQKTIGFGSDDKAANHRDLEETVTTELKKTFKPEFLNRVDDTIVFHALDKENILQIVSLEFNKVAKRIAQKGIEATLSDEAKSFLGEKGYDPNYGARPLRRMMQKYVEDFLAEEVLKGNSKGKEKVLLSKKKDQDSLEFIWS